MPLLKQIRVTVPTAAIRSAANRFDRGADGALAQQSVATCRRSNGLMMTRLSLAIALLAAACGGSAATSSGTPGSGGQNTGTGASSARGGTTGTGTGGATSTGAGGMTSAGTGGMSGAGADPGSGTAGAGGNAGTGGTIPIGGSSGVFSCTPGVEQLIITDCGYPAVSSNPLTSTVFNENEVLRAIRPAGSWPNGVVQMFYNDEHAMTLGVRQVAVKMMSGTTMTDYPVTVLASNPGSSTNPQTGTNMLVGDQSGLDASLRPMWPALFITDISTDPMNRSGDWQMGGVPRAPNAIFGSWKSAVRTVDYTKNPATVSITPDADPTKNNANLGPGADPVPAGLANEGFGAEARWDVTLTPGHSYRLQVLVHDGDQNKVGGDSGEGCVLFCAGTDCQSNESCGSTGTGGSGGGPSCPEGVLICAPGGDVTPANCPEGTVCANGCCLTLGN
jgi:hypothetical protein